MSPSDRPPSQSSSATAIAPTGTTSASSNSTQSPTSSPSCTTSGSSAPTNTPGFPNAPGYLPEADGLYANLAVARRTQGIRMLWTEGASATLSIGREPPPWRTISQAMSLGAPDAAGGEPLGPARVQFEGRDGSGHWGALGDITLQWVTPTDGDVSLDAVTWDPQLEFYAGDKSALFFRIDAAVVAE